jgi:hypothetical protein
MFFIYCFLVIDSSLQDFLQEVNKTYGIAANSEFSDIEEKFNESEEPDSLLSK